VLQVSLDCPFLIAPSVFSNVYFHPAGVTSVSGLSILCHQQKNHQLAYMVDLIENK
jgi:hypothetical protein